MQTCNVIEDGYTRRGYVKPDPGIHEGLAFEYRPMLAERVQDLDDAVAKARPDEKIRLIAIALAGGGTNPSSLVSWSEVDSKGVARPITFDSVRRLTYQLLRDVKSVICGMWAGDPLPDATDEEESEFAKALREQQAGNAPGLKQLAADQKNC